MRTSSARENYYQTGTINNYSVIRNKGLDIFLADDRMEKRKTICRSKTYARVELHVRRWFVRLFAVVWTPLTLSIFRLYDSLSQLKYKSDLSFNRQHIELLTFYGRRKKRFIILIF